MRDWGGILMPSVLHGFKAADPVRLNRRSELGVMVLAIVMAIDGKDQNIKISTGRRAL